jgi:hypothetical protein
MDRPDSSPELEMIFRPRKTEHLYAVLWLVGGIAALGMGVVGFVVALAIRVDQFTLHLLTTLPGFGPSSLPGPSPGRPGKSALGRTGFALSAAAIRVSMRGMTLAGR